MKKKPEVGTLLSRLPLSYFLSLGKTVGRLTGFEPGVAEKIPSTEIMVGSTDHGRTEKRYTSSTTKIFLNVKKAELKRMLGVMRKTFKIC